MLPLLAQAQPDAAIVRRNGVAITQRQFLQQAWALSRLLPQTDYAINLCEDRYHFLLTFVAMVLRGQVNLLPANRSVVELQSVAACYGHCPCIVDTYQEELDLQQFVPDFGALSGDGEATNPSIPRDQVCAVVFTSGSTGQSVPWTKHWGGLVHGAQLTQRMLALDGQMQTVVATVPAQHMYGLETTIILPLVTGMSLYAGRPFFPHDLKTALEAVPGPRLLITTPVHLNACLESGIDDWPEVSRIVSATAPLSPALAERAEQLFDCPLREIYGSTETGAIATRRTRQTGHWTLHHGLSIEPMAMEGCVRVSGGHLSRPVTLNDRVQLEDDGRFSLQGRNTDMVKIAGKRVSLGDLNNKLAAIPGVKDGVFVEPPGAEGRTVNRLCAIVVAENMTQQALLDALRIQLDPLFLPRPVHFVDRLPRNESGKLPRDALLALLKELENG